MKRALLALTVAAASLLASPREAKANGRFPESNQIFLSPKDPQEMLLRTTFGFLVSKDRGGKWEWVCEQAVPLSGSEDPMVAITPSGNIVATTFQGLGVSTNDACDWTFAGGDLASQVFIDLTGDPNDGKRVVVFASSYDHQDQDGGIFFISKLWQTNDEGASFELLGPALDPTLLGYTVDLTKSDPDRIYVSAVRNPGVDIKAFLLVSKDRGKTWTESPIALEGDERSVFIAAVDPNDADRLYLRTSSGTDGPSRLLVSKDGGATFETVYRAKGPLLGFALTPDGSKVYIGGQADGILAASTADFAFAQKSNIEVQCLKLAEDGLWACSTEKSGFIVGLSKDEGVTFEKKTHFCDIAGPLSSCGPGTKVVTECASRWPPQQSLLGCGDVDGGTGPGGADGGTGPGGDDGVDPGGGCDCHATPASPYAALASAAAALGALALVLRRRR